MRLPKRWPWYAGGAAALLLLASGGKAKAARMPSGREYESDVNALTRMLLAETAFNKSEAEMAQIVHVALNRARSRGISPAEVVYPARPSKGSAWNLGAPYRNRYNAAPGWAAWSRARTFVQRVMDGSYPNRGYTLFVHPAAPQFAPTTPCANPDRWSPTSTPGWGVRCLPNWIHGGERVGTAMFT